MKKLDEVVSHSSNEECRRSFLEAFEDTAKYPHWMAAVWCVENGKVEIVRLTQRQFSSGDFSAAIGLLGLQMHKSIERTSRLSVEPEVLPQAKPKPWQPKIRSEQGDGEKREEESP